ncbi:hypothetical protein [Empedobacter brevis]|uniref:hypothetical protein n=1 Tax=Empedobacter brevis TaxID=247 RepID=UPI0028B23F69|nr:hypothetical protein [Empedobacter brevis]
MDLYYNIEAFEIDNNGEEIIIENSVLFESEILEDVKNEITEELNQFTDWKENDLVIITITDDSSGIIFEGKIFKNGVFEELEDYKFIQKNRFTKFFDLMEYDTQQIEENLLEPIGTWEDILKNFNEFEKLDVNQSNNILKIYSQFYHWYYLPEKEIFAPSKFLGYKNRMIETYDSSGTGGETQTALSKFFIKLPKDSEEFKNLYRELEQFSKNNFNKNINSQILDGKGGIYIPKK